MLMEAPSGGKHINLLCFSLIHLRQQEELPSFILMELLCKEVCSFSVMEEGRLLLDTLLKWDHKGLPQQSLA